MVDKIIWRIGSGDWETANFLKCREDLNRSPQVGAFRRILRKALRSASSRVRRDAPFPTGFASENQSAGIVMKNILVLLFLLVGSDIKADGFRFPNRSFSGAIVNLNPLFNWWLSPTVNRPLVQNNTTNIVSVDVPRPLTSWKLIRGKVVAVRPFAFIVDAKVYTNATGYQTMRIYLYRAPLSEKSEFESLIAERNRLKVLKASAYAANKSAQEASDSYFNSASTIRIAHGENVDYVTNPNHNRYNAYEAAGRQSRQQADAAHQDWWDINDREVQVYNALNKFPDGNEYTVEWFAMDTGKKVQDMPLFDCGQPY